MSDKTKKIMIYGWLAVLLCVGIYLIVHFVTLHQRNEVYQNLQQAAVSQGQGDADTDASDSSSDSSATDASSAAEANPNDLTIDFETLQQTNPDIYAWVDIPDTVISYPVLRHPTDDAYYLDHTVDHAAGLPGSIYTEGCDALDFTGFNTVLYGHNMANDTMFGSLNEYRDRAYFEQHDEIVIYTPSGARHYTVFAAVVYDDRYIPYTYDDATQSDREAFLASIYDNGDPSDIIEDTVPVTAESELLTLSTCIGNKPNNRYLVVAVYQGEA